MMPFSTRGTRQKAWHIGGGSNDNRVTEKKLLVEFKNQVLTEVGKDEVKFLHFNSSFPTAPICSYASAVFGLSLELASSPSS